LTKYADAQTKSYLEAAKKVESLLPQLEALSTEVKEADKEFQYQRTEREEKRRTLEKSTITYVEPETVLPVSGIPGSGNGNTSDSELGRADSTTSQLRAGNSNGTTTSVIPNTRQGDLSRSPGSLNAASTAVVGPSQNSKFKGIRDLEERDHSQTTISEKNGTQRKEGLLWALSRPGSHVDPKGLNIQAWHKYGE
jgi:Arf-GAP/SH3 domain/ANK repeat/PH domain-containing protein